MNLTESSHILTILDKPKHPQSAWRRALELQKRSGAHVDAVAFCWNAMTENQAVLSAKERRKLLHALVAERKAWVHEMLGDRSNVSERTIWSNDIAGWVADTIVEEGAPDLVIKTVHKSGSLVHTPTDWQMLRTCPAPLLLTQSRRKKPSGNVLAALDLRHNDQLHRHLNCKVLDAAHELARVTDAKVHVVFAVEISQVLRDLDIVTESVSKAKVVQRVSGELQRLLRPYEVPKARIHMPVGKVGRVVAQVGRKVQADTLVVGSHAHRVKNMVGLGGSAERILTRGRMRRTGGAPLTGPARGARLGVVVNVVGWYPHLVGALQECRQVHQLLHGHDIVV